jgi:two-component system, chemotaxis family, protein-glutamate methylesterase/glutaminase
MSKEQETLKAARGEVQQQGAKPFTCPDCNGPLYAVPGGVNGEVKCIVGHRFSPETLSEAHRETLERTLLTALRMIKECATVHQNLAEGEHQRDPMKHRYEESVESAARDAALLQEILQRL